MAEPAALAVRVVRVTAEHWRTYRDVRLASLIDSPRAFWSTYAEIADRSEEEWRAFPEKVTSWLALVGERPVGTVGLFRPDGWPGEEVCLVAMWVPTVARGTGVADRLVGVAVEHAAAAGHRRLVLDVARENHRAAGFYRRLGFRPTGAVGAMPWDPSVTEETLALDLPG